MHPPSWPALPEPLRSGAAGADALPRCDVSTPRGRGRKGVLRGAMHEGDPPVRREGHPAQERLRRHLPGGRAIRCQWRRRCLRSTARVDAAFTLRLQEFRPSLLISHPLLPGSPPALICPAGCIHSHPLLIPSSLCCSKRLPRSGERVQYENIRRKKGFSYGCSPLK